MESSRCPTSLQRRWNGGGCGDVFVGGKGGCSCLAGLHEADRARGTAVGGRHREPELGLLCNTNYVSTTGQRSVKNSGVEGSGEMGVMLIDTWFPYDHEGMLSGGGGQLAIASLFSHELPNLPVNG